LQLDILDDDDTEFTEERHIKTKMTREVDHKKSRGNKNAQQ